MDKVTLGAVAELLKDERARTDRLIKQSGNPNALYASVVVNRADALKGAILGYCNDIRWHNSRILETTGKAAPAHIEKVCGDGT